ncbi:hypothetical protein F4780DRAFT_770820 [Xylariomycetidae sp. FL0641]|nr:hypothetical protein F4780DRAFT_770820 [Xylariomycetidae sp. FL0641]
MAETKASYSTDPALYIYTSLTAGSSHIVTATSRLETILRANKVPFKAIDLATDEKARMLWGRRAGKDPEGRVRKLPGLVQMGLVLGDLVEIEDWNEYGELKQHVTIYYDDYTIPSKSQAPPAAAPKKKKKKPASTPATTAATPAATSSSATTSTPPPAAPPLPTGKERIPTSSETGDATTSKKPSSGITSTAASAASSVAEGTKTIAEEAAEKAKQVRLNTLREKVHGKKDASSASPAAASPVKDEKQDASTTNVASATTGMSELTIGAPGTDKAAGEAGLQSPTTGTWRAGVPPDAAIAPTMQSPTSGTWHASEAANSGPTDAPPEKVAAVESATAIPEAAAVESGNEEGKAEEEKK